MFTIPNASPLIGRSYCAALQGTSPRRDTLQQWHTVSAMAPSDNNSEHTPEELPRRLSLRDSLAIVVGIMIGGGIFLVPNLVARSLRSMLMILGECILAGAVSFAGALACAELGAAFPQQAGNTFTCARRTARRRLSCAAGRFYGGARRAGGLVGSGVFAIRRSLPAARSRMLMDGLDAAGAAFEAGYENASQIQSRIQPFLRPNTHAGYSSSSLAGRSAI